MISNSREVKVVTNSRKFMNRCFTHIAPISRVNNVVTDSKIPDEESKSLSNMGIDVIIVE